MDDAACRRTNRVRAAVVEDDVLIRTLLADMLCEIGYTVAAEAASIDEALATRKTDFDLAILDANPRAGPSRRSPMPSSPVT
jgi:DNA-binding response OmpR family regulator